MAFSFMLLLYFSGPFSVLLFYQIQSLTMAVTSFAQSYGIIGSVLTTDIKAYIDGVEIPAYNVDGNMVVIGSDLRNYGFNVVYDNSTRTSNVTPNPRSTRSPLPVVSYGMNNIGTKIMDVYDTDISVLLNGIPVTSYNVNGNMAFKFSELKIFGSYYYDNELRETNLWINEASFTTNEIVDVAEIPNVLTDIRVVPGYGQLTVYGTEHFNSLGYEIYASTSLNGYYLEKLYTTGIDQDGTVISDLQGNTTYYLKIRAVYQNGDYSDFSKIISAQTYEALDVVVAPPTITSAIVENDTVTLTWTDDPAVVDYTLYVNGIYYFGVDELTTNTYTFTNLDIGKEYRFNVVAKKIVAGQSYVSDFSPDYYVRIDGRIDETTQKVPYDILMELSDMLTEAVTYESEGLQYCMKALYAGATTGTKQAQSAQSCFLKASTTASAASVICADYSDLHGAQALFLTASTVAYANGLCPITSQNYLEYAVLVCEGSNTSADIYEEITNILVDMIENY